MVIRASDTLPAVPDRPILDLLLGDVVRLRRTHPCGGDTWLVDRLGADIGLRCRTCGRHVLIERATLERRLAGFVERGDPTITAAVDRRPSLERRDPARPSIVTDSGVPLESDAIESDAEPGTGEGALAVFRNPPFLRLWLSQAATQIGGNMVLFGLTVVVSENNPNTAVSLLILSFLVPAVLFSAVAGVYVDRIDRRLVLIATNVLRGFAMIGIFLVGDHLLLLLLLNLFVSTVTVFFAPAEAAMIPEVVPRQQLLAANGVFTLTLNAAFALGFALLGPLVIKHRRAAGRDPGRRRPVLPGRRVLLDPPDVAATRPSERAGDDRRRDPAGGGIDAGPAPRGLRDHQVESVDRVVPAVPRHHGVARRCARRSWSRLRADLPSGCARRTSQSIVLPLGLGIVMGILLLNSYGKFLPRRRVIEGGLILLGVMLALLSVAGPISQFLQRVDRAGDLLDLSAITSLLADRGLHRLHRRHRLFGGGDPGTDAAPGGSARGRARPRLRCPEHAGVGVELPADHRRRADLRLHRHGDGDARPWRSP